MRLGVDLVDTDLGFPATVAPTAAQSLELDAIAAVILVGTSLFGGRSGVIGTFFAVMLLQVLRNIFNLLGLGSFYQMTVTGVIIVLAIH